MRKKFFFVTMCSEVNFFYPRAITHASTRVVPAFFNAFAHAFNVAPVVAMSSISTTCFGAIVLLPTTNASCIEVNLSSRERHA